jgi:UDP-N-acetylglucosamine:LPS N-acetylglucosamine transferase
MAAQQKIAFVVPYRFVPPLNGGHKAAYGFSQFLSLQQEMIAYSTTDNNSELARFPMRLLLPASITKYFSLIAMIRLYQSFKKENIQHCITHQPFIAFLLFPICWLLSVPLSIYAQNLEYQRFKTMGKKWWSIVFLAEWISFKLANHIYFISPDEVSPASKIFRLNPEKCSILPFGTDYQSPPADVDEARRTIRQQHAYPEDEFIIIFFGPQSYQPNLEAVELIINEIEPLLRIQATFSYRFIICGGGLPKQYNRLEDYPNIDYLGFVQDIEAYVKASDIMINPVNSGGGVKTKLIESIALNKTVISSETGALGVNPEVCGAQLIRVDDFDYDAYVKAILALQSKTSVPDTPSSFYDYYFWGNIVARLNTQ